MTDEWIIGAFLLHLLSKQPEVLFSTKYDTKSFQLFQLFSLIDYFFMDQWYITSCPFFSRLFVSIFYSEFSCVFLFFDELFFQNTFQALSQRKVRRGNVRRGTVLEPNCLSSPRFCEKLYQSILEKQKSKI